MTTTTTDILDARQCVDCDTFSVDAVLLRGTDLALCVDCAQRAAARVDALRAAHAPHCDDEACRGCIDCYRRTGATVCDRRCQHATEDAFTAAERAAVDAAVLL